MAQRIGACLLGLLLPATVIAGAGEGTVEIYPTLKTFITARVAEFDQIPAERRTQLDKLAAYVMKRIGSGDQCSLCFICTHNSRRSHLAQIWAATAASHYGIEMVHTYSGGTEATAFNPRAVSALERAGFSIVKTTDDKNPVYHVRSGDKAMPLTCFSKVYDQAPNPKEDYCAVMTCSDADRKCPNARGATERIAITYEDPKAADGTPDEARRYDERCQQIAREMLYVFSQVRANINRGA